MMPDLNVLICGKIRSPEILRRDLEFYLRWRAAGEVGRIVFSGWSNERERQPDLIRHMLDTGLEVVLSPEPRLTVGGNIFHQTKALHYGLSAFDDGDLVLKVRTDNNWLEERLAGNVSARTAAAPPPGEGSPFRRRVMILTASLHQPFFFNDMMYVGLKQDLQQFASFDLWWEYEHTWLNAEQILHVTPFLEGRGHLREYFRATPGLIHDSAEDSRRLNELLLRHELHRRCVHDSLVALRDSYLVGFDTPPAARSSDPDLTLHRLLDRAVAVAGEGAHYSDAAQAIGFSRQELVEVFLAAPVSPEEPRSLLQLFGRRSGRSGSPGLSYGAPARALAEAVRAEFPRIYLPPPLTEGALTVYRDRGSLLLGLS